MAELLRLYNDAPDTPPANHSPATTGLLRLYSDAPAPAAAPKADTSLDPLVPIYAASGANDTSGRPLEMFNNPKAGQTQLLRDRIYPGFDPTKPQKLDRKVLVNGRMQASVSAAIKKQLGGAYAD